jgi:hypothetical protein
LTLGTSKNLRWILATPSLTEQGVKLKQCLDLARLRNAGLSNLAKPLRARLKGRFFVVVRLDLRMTKNGNARLEDVAFESRRISLVVF